jgi:hypothetical protein
MLFVAAERPFRFIRGVEFAEYEFPNDNLVVYLFNPFGPGVLRPMLQNLQRSIDLHPRHVVVLLLWPVHGSLVAEMPTMRPYKLTRRYHIYQTARWRE